METFLTKSTYKYLEQHLEIKSERHVEVAKYEKYLTKYLSEKLYRLNGLQNTIMEGVPKKLSSPRDTYAWINVPKLGRYHIKKKCSALKSDYHNWPIPEEIKQKGPEAVNEYREWCKKNDLFGAMSNEGQRPRFDLLHQSRWGFYYQGKGYNEDNSGIVSKDFLTKEEIEQELKSWRTRFNNWLCTNEAQGSGMYAYYIGLYSWPSKKSDHDLEERCRMHNHNFGDVERFLDYYREHFQYTLVEHLESLIIFELNGINEKNIPMIEALGIKPCKMCAV